MKHLVRIVAVLGIVVMPAAAQAQPSAGVRAGVNVTTVTSDPARFRDPEPASGFVAGAFVLLPVNNGFGFQPEALYSRQGWNDHVPDISERTTHDYIQFPLLARARIGMRSPFAVLVGPSLGVRVMTSYDVKGTSPGYHVDPDSEFRRFDLGIVTGAALDVGQVVVDGRYTWGVTSIFKDESGSGPSGAGEKNRVFSLSAGVRF